MPFVTKSGGFCLDDGVVRPHKNEKGEYIPGNSIQTKVLVNIGATGLDPETEEYKMCVMRGTPRPNGTSWESSPVPVFIIQHYTFDKEDWERLLSKYDLTLAPSGTTPSFGYEPAICDIVDMEFGRREMPLWVIEWLEEKGIFDKALNETKIESRAKKLTESQHALLKKAISDRKRLEAPVAKPNTFDLGADDPTEALAAKIKAKQEFTAKMKEAREAAKAKKLAEKAKALSNVG